MDKKFIKTDFFCVSLLLFVACINVFARPYFGTLEMGDTKSYIGAIEIMRGQPAEIDAHTMTRILKPLPLWGIMALSDVLGLDLRQAFIVESIFCYLALAAAIYYLLKLFFGSAYGKHLLVAGSLLFVCSYPMLRGGISMLVEAGAILSYVLAIYFIIKFYHRPILKYFLLANFIIIAGFMWKEYSALAGALFFLVIVFHPVLTARRKIGWLAAYAVLSLALFLPWQIYAYEKFGYTLVDWYKQGQPASYMLSSIYYAAKSLFAVYLAGWLFVVAGAWRWRSLLREQKFLLKVIIAVSLMIFIWKSIDSRLYYVTAVPLTIMAVMGIKRLINRRGYYTIAIVYGLVLGINYLWLGVADNFRQVFSLF